MFCVPPQLYRISVESCRIMHINVLTITVAGDTVGCLQLLGLV